MNSVQVAAVALFSLAAAQTVPNATITGDLPLWQTFLKYQPACHLPLDLMFLQDSSVAEDEDFMPTMSSIMQDVAGIIDWLHPDSRFAVAEFRDKPFAPYGWSNDVCFSLAQQFTDDRTQMESAYDALWAGGGYDHEEDHFTALMDAFGWNGVQWRNVSMTPGDTGARVVVLLTDSLAHYAGSHDNTEYPDGVVPNDGVVTQDNITMDCVTKQYPSAAQMASIVKAAQHQSVVIVIPNTAEEHVQKFWRYVNDKVLGQAVEMMQMHGPEPKDLETAVLNGLRAVTLEACSAWESYVPDQLKGRLTIMKGGRVTSWNPRGVAISTPKMVDSCSNACSCECSCSVECPEVSWRCCTGDDGIVVITHQNSTGQAEAFSVMFGNRTKRHLW